MSRQDCNVHLAPIAEELNNNTVVYRANAEKMYIIPIADLHFGALNHNAKAFDSFLATLAKLKNTYIILGGDSTEHATTTKSAGSPFEQNLSGIEQILQLRTKLLPFRDRILFVRTGNHGYERSQRLDGLAPERMLAELLNVPYCEGFGAVAINVKKNQYVIATQHNRKAPSQFQWLHSDITIFEHDHKSPGHTIGLCAKFNAFSKTWGVREHLDVCSGSWMSWGGYAKHTGYKPNLTGSPVIELTGTRNVWDMRVHQKIEHFIDVAKGRGHYGDNPVHDAIEQLRT